MTWWRNAVVYQIYPRSFADSNGDGVGDLDGIRSKLGYLHDLGIDAIWLSPIFPSPMRDFGYDVSDYTGIDPIFGSLADFDALVREAHERGIRVLLDWVPNHTSSDHPWFSESRASASNARRDWYVWRDAKPDGSVPNNWVRAWSEESVWTWDETTAQYYLHCFLPSQPDLNWANVDVRAAMHETLRFWLDRGVDGFRMDVIHLLGKEIEHDDSEELRLLSHTPLNDVVATHDYLREIRHVLDGYEGDRVSVGEVYLFELERVASYYGHHDELHLSFNFSSLYTPWRASAWRDVIERTEAALGAVEGWPTWVLSNHDNARVATRLGGDLGRIRAALTLLLTLRGTPFLYAGDELGLEDALIAPEREVDPGGRDGCRSPVPWTTAVDHGWPAEPWLPFARDSDTLSVESQMRTEDSTLHFTRRLLALRKTSAALSSGRLTDLSANDDVVMFDRVEGTSRLRVMINFTGASVTAPSKLGRVLLTSVATSLEGVLDANEAVILELAQ